MTAFSKEYFSENRSLFTYSDEDATAASALLHPMEIFESAADSDRIQELPAEVTLDELVNFFKNPMKVFLTKQRGVMYRSGSDLVLDEELFELNALEKYQIQDDRIQAWRDQVQDDQELEFIHLKAKGRLPHGNVGRIVYEKTIREIEELLAKIEKETSGERETEIEGHIGFSIDGSQTVLSGIVSGIYGQKRVAFRPTGNIKGKDMVELWLNHLFINCLAGQRTSFFYAKSGNPYELCPPKTKLDAKTALEQLLLLYQQYNNQPMPFIPSISYEYASQADKKSSDAAVFKAEANWNSDRNFDRQDIYFNLCMNHFGIFKDHDGTEHFKECAERVFSFLNSGVSP